MSEKESLVTFNVGGEPFTIRQSLLDQFPSTVLARSASKEWHGNDNPEHIFLDRDGQTFRQVLKYMRDGRVHLAPTESKENLLEELSYLGFEGVPSDCIDYDSQSVAACAQAYQTILKRGQESVRQTVEQANTMNPQAKYEKIALMLYQSFAEKDQTHHCFSSDTEVYSLLAPNELKKQVFKDCLSKYGLKLVSYGYSSSGVSVRVAAID